MMEDDGAVKCVSVTQTDSGDRCRMSTMHSDVVGLLVIGAGNRGEIYARYALERPHEAQVVAIVDPTPICRNRLGRAHSIKTELLFASCPPKNHFIWSQIDAAIIAVPDSLHSEMVQLVLSRGLKFILLEKPMGTTREECQQIVDATLQNNACVAVCHVLRYTPMNREIKRLIDSDEIGQVLNIQHTEPIGYYHFAHSYVRGNWRRTDESACSLLTKSCHDVDLIAYWMSGVEGGKVRHLSSFGSRRHFRHENKPIEAGDCQRCLDCPYETKCPYSAKKIYLEAFQQRGIRGWPTNVIVEEDEVTKDSILDALRNGPYGRCVYECDNDVCDNQVVNFQFDNGSTASFTMIATTEQLCTRQTKIYASRAEVIADGRTGEVRIFEFLTQSYQTYRPGVQEENEMTTTMTGHGNADFHLMGTFVQAVAQKDPTLITTSATESFKTHSLVFDAEESRLSVEKTFSW